MRSRYELARLVSAATLQQPRRAESGADSGASAWSGSFSIGDSYASQAKRYTEMSIRCEGERPLAELDIGDSGKEHARQNNEGYGSSTLAHRHEYGGDGTVMICGCCVTPRRAEHGTRGC
jgi:hypothetical protein